MRAANPEILFVHNSSTDARPLLPVGAPENGQHAWAATPVTCPAGAVSGCVAVALFNAGNATAQVVLRLGSLGLAGAQAATTPLRLCGRDLWRRAPLVGTTVLDVFAPKARSMRPRARDVSRAAWYYSQLRVGGTTSHHPSARCCCCSPSALLLRSLRALPVLFHL